MYSEIFELDDKIKDKEREIVVLKRALKYQDTSMKKLLSKARNGAEATELERQIILSDSLRRQTRTAQN